MRNIISISGFNYALIPPKGISWPNDSRPRFLTPQRVVTLSREAQLAPARAPLSRNKCAERAKAGNWVAHGNRWTDIDITIRKLSHCAPERVREREIYAAAHTFHLAEMSEKERGAEGVERGEDARLHRVSGIRDIAVDIHSPKSRAVCCRPLLPDTPLPPFSPPSVSLHLPSLGLLCCLTDSRCLASNCLRQRPRELTRRNHLLSPPPPSSNPPPLFLVTLSSTVRTNSRVRRQVPTSVLRRTRRPAKSVLAWCFQRR